MEEPILPLDEAIRLLSLKQLNILDTPAEEQFDRITRLACRVFDVPIALVSLVDSKRQWFKSKQGLDACETGRDISFCGHAILGDELFYIPNALKDSRFADNPLVIGEPNIRMYAGVPIATPSESKIGTLCIIDTKPRNFTAADLALLCDLADTIESELALREYELAIPVVLDYTEQNRMKTEFINLVSHELRTPLTVILGYLPILKKPEQLPSVDAIVPMVEEIECAGNHLLQLINDLLDISKIEAGKLTIRPTTTPIEPILNETVDQFKGLLVEKGVELHCDILTEQVYADPVRLRQIIYNLIGNAVKFTDAGAIRIQVKEEDSHTLLQVVDTGPGIPAKELPEIFDKFRQVDSSSTRKSGGSGLGLAITKQLIALHNGEITAESEYGKGSCFTVKLPNKADKAETAINI